MSLRLATLLVLVLGTLGCEDILGGTAAVDDGSGPVSSTDLAGVQAFGTVVRGADGTVSARLDVVTLSGEPRFLSGIANPTVSFGSTTVPLTTGAGVGVFVTNDRQAPTLQYLPGQTYLFGFTILDDEGVQRVYRSAATAPEQTPVAEIAPVQIRFAGEPVEVGLTGMGNGGILRVAGPDGVTYDTSAIADLSELALVRQRMHESVGPFETIPGSAFGTPGTYTLEVTSLQVADAEPTGADEAELGDVSWFGAGVTTSLTLATE